MQIVLSFNPLFWDSFANKLAKCTGSNMIKVMSVFGTRPEAIKMCPLVKQFEKEEEIDLTKLVRYSRNILKIKTWHVIKLRYLNYF